MCGVGGGRAVVKEQEEEEALALWSSSWCPSCCLELNLGSNTLKTAHLCHPRGSPRAGTGLLCSMGSHISLNSTGNQ